MLLFSSGQWLLGTVATAVALVAFIFVVPRDIGSGMNVNTLDFSPGSRSRNRVYRTIAAKLLAAVLPIAASVAASGASYFGLPLVLPDMPPWLAPLISAAFLSPVVALVLKAGMTELVMEGRDRARRALSTISDPVPDDARKCVLRGNNPLLIQTLLVLGAVCGIQVFASRLSQVSGLTLDEVLASAAELERHGLVRVSTVAQRSTPEKWYGELTAKGVQAAAG